MSPRLGERGCPQVHRRDRAKNPRACGPCGQPSPLTNNTVAALQRTANGGSRSTVAVSGFRLRARLGISMPPCSLRPARRYPRFWI
jgi:hypothetical protein